MTLYKHEAGENLYVWTTSKLPGPTAVEAVISAHGCSARINQMAFTPPPTLLAFYCAHGDAMLDHGLAEIVYGMQRPTEKLRTDQCQDYELSKYQNSQRKTRNKSGESYQSIENIEEAAQDLKMRDVGILEGLLEADPDLLTDQELVMAANTAKDIDQLDRTTPMNIVTLRSRFHLVRRSSSMLLSQLIQQLRAAEYNFRIIHCAFCRSA